MKKLFTLLLAVTMAFTCFAVFASAADSPEGAITAITGVTASQTNVAVTRRNFTGNIAEYNRVLDELKQTNPNYTILDRRDVMMNPADYKLPITLTFAVSGVKADQEGYIIYTDKDGAVKKIAATMADGKMSATFDSYVTAVAVAVAAKTTSNTDKPGTTSPETASADAAVPFAMVATVLLAVAAVYSVKKIKE